MIRRVLIALALIAATLSCKKEDTTDREDTTHPRVKYGHHHKETHDVDELMLRVEALEARHGIASPVKGVQDAGVPD